LDRTRFVELATAEWRAVYRFALRLARDPHRAEDLVQDVYAQALKPERIEAFEPRGGGVRAWLLRVTYRSFLSMVERSRRDGATFRELVEGDDAVPETVSATSARDFDWDGVDARIKGAVAHLDQGSRDVLLLWAVERLQYHEIASVLEIPIGTVMSRLHRARSRVSKELLSDPDAVEDLGLRPLESPLPGLRDGKAES
jgi:RNA polymerase sigma-70 factor (ECF subfamily)